MKPGEAQQFLHRNTIWLIRGLGIFVALIIPPYRYLFPEASYDPMWMRWALAGLALSVVCFSFISKKLVRFAVPVVNLYCCLLMGWMLGLSSMNGLSQAYASSYFIMLFCSLILMRDWRWLLPVAGLNLVGVVIVALLVKDAEFSPAAFAVMSITILMLSVAGIATGWMEFSSVTQRELQLRSINRAAFGTAVDAIVVTDISGDVLTFNAVFRDTWKPFEQKIGEPSATGWIPLLQGMVVDPNLIVKITQMAFRNPKESITELLPMRDGRYIKVRSQPVVEDDQTLGRIWFFRDVTKSQRSAEAMLQSQERLQRQNAALVRLSLHEEMHGSDFSAALQLVTMEVVHSLDADRAGVWRLENAQQELVCEDVYFRATGLHQSGAIVSAGQSPAYFHQLGTARVIHIPNAAQNPLTQGFKLPYVVSGKERNVLDVPLRISGQLYGVLSAEREGKDWAVEDQQFLASVGDLLAVFFESIERRKAEAQLANSVALLKAVFESTGVGILVTRPDRTVIDCNSTYLSIFKLDRDFALNGPADEVIAHCRAQTKDPQALAASMQFLLQNPNENHSENLVFHDGRIVERYTEVLQVDAAIVGRVWFYRDVTERVRHEQAILDSEKRNQAIIGAIPDLMIRVRSDGHLLDMKKPEAGPLADLLALDDAKHLSSLFSESFANEILSGVGQALEKMDLVAYETEMEFHGQMRDLEVRLTPSGPGEALLMLRDVTDRKKTERELMQRNHELDSFVYRASHDLKAPLNSLMGLIEIIKTESKDAQLTTYLRLMDKSVLKLDTFIRNLTDFSKVARLEISRQTVNFAEIVEEINESLKYMDNADRVRKEVEIMEGPGFVGDGFHIGIVLGNLMSNAVKYQDLKKPDSWSRVTVKITAKECTITVEDNGMGIPKIHQSRIFDLFYRATNQSFGSGLGLYITRNAVEKMKGTIEMFSTEGVGTKFVVTLPSLQIEADKAAGAANISQQ